MEEKIQEAVVENAQQEVKKEVLPEPEVIDYDESYTITDNFIHDLRVVLRDLEYSKADAFVRFAVAKKDKIIAAELHEFIDKIGHLPYGYVCDLMDNIKDEKCFVQYFVKIKK